LLPVAWFLENTLMTARRPGSSARPSSSFHVHALLAASVFAGALSLNACQSEDEPKKAAPPVGSAGSSSGTGGKGGSTNGGAGTEGGGNAAGENSGAGSGGSDTEDPCGGIDGTIAQVNNAAAEGAIKKDARVKIKGAVVTSHKFLASASSCLWAVTITMPGTETQEYGSIQLTGKGTPAPLDDQGNKGACPTGAEGGVIPDDIKPGDTLDFTAYANEFIQASCGTDPNPKPVAGQKQLELGKLPAECFTRTPGDAVPAPHVFATTAEMTAFASGTNEGDVNYKWGAALITLQGPIKPKQSDKAADYPSADAAVSKYGDMLLDGTSLAVNNNVLYQDITGAGPKDSAKRVSWPLTTEFASITGLGMVDFCSWSLSLRAQCGDATPAATECTKLHETQRAARVAAHPGCVGFVRRRVRRRRLPAGSFGPCPRRCRRLRRCRFQRRRGWGGCSSRRGREPVDRGWRRHWWRQRERKRRHGGRRRGLGRRRQRWRRGCSGLGG
jgi:hypothetical protein